MASSLAPSAKAPSVLLAISRVSAKQKELGHSLQGGKDRPPFNVCQEFSTGPA